MNKVDKSYFVELRVHFEPALWKEYADTAKEHPQAAVIRTITTLYKELGAKTLVMPASIVTGKEVSTHTPFLFFLPSPRSRSI